MKPSLSKLKNVRGRVTAHVATIGPIVADGKTPKAAADACEKAAADALDRLDRGTYLGTFRGHAFAVFPDVSGWRYWLDTFTGGHYIGLNGARERAIDSAIHHLAQVLWTHEEDDAAFLATLPPSLRADLAQWIRFQRAYVTFRAQGYSDTDCHRLACEASSREAA